MVLFGFESRCVRAKCRNKRNRTCWMDNFINYKIRNAIRTEVRSLYYILSNMILVQFQHHQAVPYLTIGFNLNDALNSGRNTTILMKWKVHFIEINTHSKSRSYHFFALPFTTFSPCDSLSFYLSLFRSLIRSPLLFSSISKRMRKFKQNNE